MSAAEQRHLARVASLPCCLCACQPVEVHHILEGRIKGRKASDFCTIPLCPDCHRGNHNGVHGAQAMLKVMRVTELELLARTIELLYGNSHGTN